MQPNSMIKTRLLIIAGAGVVLLLVIFVALAAKSSSDKKASATPTPSASATPVADTVAKGPSMPKFYGFDALQGKGVTNDQIDAAKYGFFKYSKTINKNIKEVTLSEYTVVPHNRYSASTSDIINITAKLDDTSYKGRIEYAGYYAARLYIDSSPAFDSGLIDVFHGTGI